MTAIGRGCVKTKNGTRSQNFDLPECAAFDYFWLGNGRKPPEIEMALSFYTASAGKRPPGKMVSPGANRYTSVCSAISRASSTSIPRYRTVLSSLV